jgi:hypothetical protein
MQPRVPVQRQVQMQQRARKLEPGLAQQLVLAQQQAMVRVTRPALQFVREQRHE